MITIIELPFDCQVGVKYPGLSVFNNVINAHGDKAHLEFGRDIVYDNKYYKYKIYETRDVLSLPKDGMSTPDVLVETTILTKRPVINNHLDIYAPDVFPIYSKYKNTKEYYNSTVLFNQIGCNKLLDTISPNYSNVLTLPQFMVQYLETVGLSQLLNYYDIYQMDANRAEGICNDHFVRGSIQSALCLPDLSLSQDTEY